MQIKFSHVSVERVGCGCQLTWNECQVGDGSGEIIRIHYYAAFQTIPEVRIA